MRDGLGGEKIRLFCLTEIFAILIKDGSGQDRVLINRGEGMPNRETKFLLMIFQNRFALRLITVTKRNFANCLG